ncbi:ABC transporter substrate-binding protein [Elioraea tepidiphila]|jgi:peptide/nickel transport system substrate-binding protein|uniref:ABC transporter substrate-binding protein n=1 Tax=Elioraea tepidiphila TaxID=457934 RepID=UPI0003612FA5|nr:ABC transporter substrate-binding protein [Elioraea tepidiphila]
MRILAVAALAAAVAFGPAEAKTFTWSFNSDALTLDPHSSNNTFTNAFINNIYEGLTRHNAKLEIEPALAERWELVSPTVWRFHLRRNVVFHDGSAFDADDVLFTWARLNTQGALVRPTIGPVTDVRKIDSHTVEIETSQPFPVLLSSLTHFFVMDKEWSERVGATSASDLSAQRESPAARQANGTGPFRLRTREPDTRTVLEAHTRWWDRPTHNLTEVVFQPIRSAATRTAALLSGAIDATVEIPIQDIPRIEQNPGLQVVQGPELRTIYFGFDQYRDELLYSDVKGKNPFKDRRVRQAIYQAIDVEAIKRSVMRGQSWPAGMMASPFLNGAPQDLNTRPYPYDPEASKRLLAEAGYPNGFSVGLSCPNDRYVYDERICLAVIGMLGRVGITVQPQIEPLNVWSRRVNTHDLSMFMLGHAGLPLIDAWYVLSEVIQTKGPRTGGLNSGRYSNPKIDELTQAASRETDETKRRALLREAFALEREDIAHVPLHQQPIVWASKKGIELAQAPDNRLRLWLVRMP